MTLTTFMPKSSGVLALVIGGTLWAAEDGTPISLEGASLSNVKAELGKERSKTAQPIRSLTFLPSEWPGMTISAPKPWDWSQAGYLVLDLSNAERRPVIFLLRVDDDKGADGIHHCRTAQGTIAPRFAARFAIPFGPEPMDVGVRGLPGPPGCGTLTLNGQSRLNLQHIVAIRLVLNRPSEPTTLALKEIRLMPRIELKGLVDRFGQYTKAAWPGKIHDEAELKAQKEAEEADLKAHTKLPGRDRFGGWGSEPKVAAAGFFRTEKLGGKWWLIDPDGYLFFSSGMDCVRGQDVTIVTGRESWFTWLPEQRDPLAKFFGMAGQVHSGPVKQGKTYDFFLANLVRKYGSGAEQAFRKTSLERLTSWGFNTIANWSDESYYRNGRVPYTATAGVHGQHKRVSSGSDYWGQMHDPFDPAFAANAKRSLSRVAARVQGDPWCIGYFVDNELSWGSFNPDDTRGRLGLALGTLAAGPDSPAKAALLAQLKANYEDVAKLNMSWDTSFSSWDTLLQQSWKPETLNNKALKADLTAFSTEFARQYFRTIRDALKALDPDHLYLGCRFAWKTREAIEASAEFCDVVSFNIYERTLDSKGWSFVNDLNKPAIIGEFHIGALDRGMWHTGLQAAADQNERARVFEEYVGNVLDHPAFVGCHWFQYTDEPLTGRHFDGENYNIGFVTVTDSPYPELVAAARSVHRDMYARRAGRSRH
jgi:hypothetical protein